jgi:hypothetical protein
VAENQGRKNLLKRIFCFAIVGLILGAAMAMANESEKKQTAIASAERWLTIVDKGNYSASWKEASEFFRQAVDQGQWKHAVRSIRKPLGKLVSRKLKSASYTTSLPGAPDGEYVVIQFDASFENKKSGIETVTPMMDKDGKWRGSGYYLK